MVLTAGSCTLSALRSSMARYPSGTPSRPTVRSKTLPGLDGAVEYRRQQLLDVGPDRGGIQADERSSVASIAAGARIVSSTMTAAPVIPASSPSWLGTMRRPPVARGSERR